MEGSKTIKNPLKRCFQTMESMPESVESMDVDKDENFVPRQYANFSFSPFFPFKDCTFFLALYVYFVSMLSRYHQTEAVQVVMKRNTISVLKNEAEKNSIAVMMIKEIGKSIKLNDQKKLIIFLAPTVQLVHQVCSFACF